MVMRMSADVNSQPRLSCGVQVDKTSLMAGLRQGLTKVADLMEDFSWRSRMRLNGQSDWCFCSPNQTKAW